jgi:cytochrome c5
MLGESTMRAVCAGMFLFTACAVAGAQARHEPIELAPALGRDVVQKYCGICHSLDYLTMNSPILDRQGWTSEVNKMINSFGAPINPYETAIIIDYLANNYGMRSDMRSKRDR